MFYTYWFTPTDSQIRATRLPFGTFMCHLPSGQRIPTPQTALTEWHWALLASGLNNTWEWLEKDLTLVTIPGAGHFVQQDTPELVNRAMLSWLNR